MARRRVTRSLRNGLCIRSSLYYYFNKNVSLLFMNFGIRKYSRQLLIIVFLLLSATYCSAQVELSSGIDLTYPLLLNSNNSKPNYGQISFGISFGIAYKPPETQFFPIRS